MTADASPGVAESPPPTPSRLEIWGVAWPEIGPGDDLVALLAAEADLRDGDVVVVTSKVLSKAEGRLLLGDRAGAIADQTTRVVARRGATVIAQTPHGLVMAAAGVDASNTPPGTVLLLPADPDGSARAIRAGVYAVTGRNVAVVVSDTAGRAWRVGQTDMAIGCAGLLPVHDLQGTLDTFGNELQVTAAAVADELAAATDLVKAKTTGRPAAVVRGMSAAVLAPGVDGPGASSLIRDAASDFFGLGVREAVVAAARRTDPQALDHFPDAGSDLTPFVGVVDEWLSGLTATQRAGLAATLVAVDCSAGTGGTVGAAGTASAWGLRVDVPVGVPADVLIEVGRLMERADVLAAGHRMSGHDVPPTGRTIARCFHPRPA